MSPQVNIHDQIKSFSGVWRKRTGSAELRLIELPERTGARETVVDPVPVSELAHLDALLEELDFVNSCSESMAIHDRH